MSNSAKPRLRLDPGKRRELILEAASDLFAERGYDQASMRAIASAAGVTTPVLYDHFESKAELYTALLQAYADALFARWADPPAGASAGQLFSGSIDAFFTWIEENEQGWRMLFLDSPTDKTVAATQRAIQDRATRASAAQFAQVPALEVSASVDRDRVNELFAESVKTALNGIAAWWWNNRDVTREEILALSTDILWRGVAAVTMARA